MPDVNECLAQCRYLIEKGLGNEPAKLVLPRREAQKRRVNEEKRTRIQFDADEVCYRDFHAQLQRYRERCGNVTIAHHLMVKVLSLIKDEVIDSMAEEGLECTGNASRV